MRHESLQNGLHKAQHFVNYVASEHMMTRGVAHSSPVSAFDARNA